MFDHVGKQWYEAISNEHLMCSRGMCTLVGNLRYDYNKHWSYLLRKALSNRWCMRLVYNKHWSYLLRKALSNGWYMRLVHVAWKPSA